MISTEPKRFRSLSHWTIEMVLDHYSIPEPMTGCIICWKIPPSDGYPLINVGGQQIRAHRAAWVAQHGVIPEGLHVLHRCDFPPCVNVDHLFTGTHAQNMADKTKKGRQPRGAAVAGAKLTEELVRLIRSDPRSQRQIAAEFGVTGTTVCRIKARQKWGWVPDAAVISAAEMQLF